MTIKQILSFIVCPYCKSSLQIKDRQAIVCKLCHSSYQIIEGVPVLMKRKLLNFQEKSQAEWFEKHYSQFSRTRYVLENWRESMLRRVLEVNFQKEVVTYLDIGCGATGYTVIEAARRKNWLSFGVDISLSAMLKARALARRQKVENKTAFIVCSAEYLPFRANSVDYLSAISLLEHIENDRAVVCAAADILKERGFFYICVPNSYKKMWPFLWPIYRYLDWQIGHKRHYSIEGLTKLMPGALKLRRRYYNGHLIKLVQLVLEKFCLLNQDQWWKMENMDINQGSMGLQLNAIYQKTSHGESFIV